MKADDTYKPPYGSAALAGAAIMLLYTITLAPTTAFWDTSEYIATAHIMGIPHPPGNPLFVLLARSWDILLAPTGLSVAVRINLFSAIMSALAHGFWFLVADRILVAWSPGRVFRTIGASAAVLLSATAFTVWNQSNVNEKVYTVSLFSVALLSWLALRWRDNDGRAGNDNVALVVVFLLALNIGNHLMAVLASPALLVFMLFVRPRLLTEWRFLAACCIAVVLAISVQMFLPIRAQQKPLINEADPSCASMVDAAVSVITFGKRGCVPLSDALARRQYQKPSLSRDPVAAFVHVDLPRSPEMVAAQVANYLQYLDWQWARSVAGNNGWFGGARPLITLIVLAIGLYGARSHWRRDRAAAAYLGVLMLTFSIGLVVYLNFRYGFISPWRDATGSNTEVRERDYFFLISFSIWGVWTGIGLASLWHRLPVQHRMRTAPAMAVALVPLFANWSWASRAGDYVARDWAYNLLMSVEPYGVLVTNGDNDTFPLWYVQEVEGVRQDVTVIVSSYLNTDWYARQLRDITQPCPVGESAADDRTRTICQRAYVPDANTVDLYPLGGDRDAGFAVSAVTDEPGARAPTHSILDLTDEQIATISQTAYRATSSTFHAGSISSQIAAGTFIVPADLFLAQIIKSSIDDRPIYFAMTTSPSAYGNLGLTDFLVRQGVAYRLNNGMPVAGADTGIVEIGALPAGMPRFFDVPRTEVLATKVFVHHAGFPEEWNHWTDVATEQVPQYYASTLGFLAELLYRQGNAARGNELMLRAEPFMRLATRRQTEDL